ncbi:MAG: hypothetical protein JWO13_1527 [Acidobacteriales bacterium]|nr:hypothetical protein [Terriglobales bacterium]
MEAITLVPVGVVRNSITQPVDDVWGGLISTIELDSNRFTPRAIAGLDTFSHVEIIYHFHSVPENDICLDARHPRGRSDWPEVGVFAQRVKNRPNRLGVTVCRLLKVSGLSIEVEGLDAIDGTPVLDIKPYMKEFAPSGVTQQPQWATELMSHYWNSAGRK